MTATEPRTPPELPKGYEPGSVEQRLYQFWEEGGYFKPRPDPSKKPFTISLPPPNVTGVLHMGHMLTATLEDIMIRYHRMRGDPTLWVPGEDHAGIATQAVVERHLAAEGTNRHKLGRDAFTEEIWKWVGIHKQRIQAQMRRFGSSVDWSRERFTLDDGLSRAVREVFVTLYDEGLIYRGERIINWCPHDMSAISDLEVINQDTPGKLTYISYPLDPQEGDPPQGHLIVVATTRPETMLGDTAIAVHPQDERYRDWIDRNVVLPLMGRLIPIVADEAVEMSFGTGAVKVTPAHDATDFEIGQRHALPQIQVIGFDAKMTEHAGKYAGLDRYEARARVLADLEAAGRIIKQDDYTIPIGHCERCDAIIEPLISKQWFVKMQPLATPALNALRYGQLHFVPERFDKIYTNWLTNIRDWNISRQLWWGHRIPAWYCANCSATTVSKTDPDACPNCGSSDLAQDPDVLDTWFSSWLWPFSTLGWPDNTPDMAAYYPTSVMETGYDIIFFWVARMVMAGLHFTGSLPFHTVYLHGLIRDEQGRKVSKSLKNGLDPIETVDLYGADALRFTLVTISTPGNDIKLSPNRIVGNRNFANKIWNAGRFVLMTTADFAGPLTPLEDIKPRTLADKWIISRAQRLTEDVTQLIEAYQFGEAGRQIYDFLWSDFCDWYLEVSKGQMAGEGATPARTTTAAILRGVLDRALRLLHPFMPYVTEELWQYLIGQGASQHAEGDQAVPTAPERPALMPRPALIIARWPTAEQRQMDDKAEADFALLKESISRIRDARQSFDVEKGRKIHVIMVGGTRAKLLREQSTIIERLATTNPPEVLAKLAKKPEGAITLLVEDIEIYLPLEGLVDLTKERKRLDDAIIKATEDAERTRAKLANEQFVSRAKADIVQTERDRLAAQEETLGKLRARRTELG
ncbi:MAG: valine--tRNA ligase [Ktedonobacterales bacterium]|nr:valine--tRNA ligase [Ktedonobacterales bacterium]